MRNRTLLVAALLVVGFAVPVAAQASPTGSDDAGVDVTVEKITNVDINPTQLSYGGAGNNLQPRGFEATSDNGFVGVQVENSGSNNITELSVENTEPKSRPFGTGFADNYDAGNFIKMRPDNVTDFTIGVGGDGTIGAEDNEDGDFTSGTINNDPSKYHYASRVDFNASGPPTGTPQALTYIEVPGPEYRYGRFRSGDEEFFWAVETGTGGTGDGNVCDGEGGETGGATLRVGSDPHTDDEIGTVDFTSSNSGEYSEFELTTEDGSGDFGIVDGVELNTTQGNTTYTVLSWCAPTATSSANVKSENSFAGNKTFLVRTRYDLNPFENDPRNNFPDTSTLDVTSSSTGGIERLVSEQETASGSPMFPGDSFTLFTSVELPRGVASGETESGTMSIVAAAPEANS